MLLSQPNVFVSATDINGHTPYDLAMKNNFNFIGDILYQRMETQEHIRKMKGENGLLSLFS